MSSTSTAEKPVNVAVVGLGFMGVTHLRAYLANPMARVVAVCDAVRVPVNGILAGVSGNITKSDDIDLGAGREGLPHDGGIASRHGCRAGGLLHAHAAARRAGHRRAERGQACHL